MNLRDKCISPTSRRVKENYMDEGGYGRTRTVTVNDGGMTLREHYAGLALQGMYANSAIIDAPWDSTAKWMATEALRAADALIEALENT